MSSDEAAQNHEKSPIQDQTTQIAGSSWNADIEPVLAVFRAVDNKALAVLEGTDDSSLRYVVLNDLSTLLYNLGRYGEARDILSLWAQPR